MSDSGQMHDRRYAPPLAHVEDVEAANDGFALAGRGQRFWAAMLDVGIALGSMGLASWLTPWDPWSTEGSVWEPALLNAALGFAIFAVLHGVPLARRGQTLGKMALGIRIVRPDGSRASLARLLGLRYGVGSAVAIIPGAAQIYAVIDSLLIFRASRRCLHDTIADTIVVKA
jgi:uncharacterized RDD family membrane protein YckC